MRGASRIRSLLLLIGVGLYLPAADAAGGERTLTHREYQLKKMTEKENQTRAGQLGRIRKDFAAAKALGDAGNYSVACERIEKLLAQLKVYTGRAAQNLYADMLSEYQELCRKWAEMTLEKAWKEYQTGDFIAAQVLAGNASAYCRKFESWGYMEPNGIKMLAVPADLYDQWQKDFLAFNKRVTKLQQDSKSRTQAVKFALDTAIQNFDPNYKSNRDEVENLLRKATLLYQAGKYSDAAEALERIYLKDPFNMDATTRLNQLYNKMYTSGIARHSADMVGMLAYNMWSWVDPVSNEDSGITSSSSSIPKVQTSDIYTKMDQRIVPRVEIEDATFDEVIEKLKKWSREKAGDPNSGISFSIALKDSEKANLNKVSLRFSNIPLSAALRYICEDLELEYRVDNHGVTIGKSLGIMQKREFRVSMELVNRITDEAANNSEDEGGEGGSAAGDSEGGNAEGGGSAAGGRSGGEGGSSESTLGKVGEGKDLEGEALESGKLRRSNISSKMLKSVFENWGIPFGPESSVSYNKRSSILRVTNTSDNLQRLDDLLHQLEAAENPLILVEVKLVEITENDLQELGFHWAFNMYGGTASDSVTAGDSGWGLTQTSDILRDSNTLKSLDSESGDSRLITDLKLLPNFGSGLIDGVKINLSVSVAALDENSRTETLSAPKLITSNGAQATINMTKSYYFPDDWEAPEFEDSGTTTITKAPVPTWADSPTDIGIMLDVTPQVDPDMSTITLKLHPTIATYIGPTDDQVVMKRGYINYDSENPTYQVTSNQVYDVWMPIIGIRELDVTVKVKDGETIVLGGMVQNTYQTLYDKYPILGDIPLIGRLFSSEVEKKENTNLLVFVTARLLNYSGEPLQKSNRIAPDLPVFRR